jgi:hypothetical protein
VIRPLALLRDSLRFFVTTQSVFCGSGGCSWRIRFAAAKLGAAWLLACGKSTTLFSIGSPSRQTGMRCSERRRSFGGLIILKNDPVGRTRDIQLWLPVKLGSLRTLSCTLRLDGGFSGSPAHAASCRRALASVALPAKLNSIVVYFTTSNKPRISGVRIE